ncbi:aldehyde dehydrogenase family protein [Periconia macrospinosa]|uniref:Aldehyde dehydrogenase family protein n=1 Tax=Periconia macrospinosa TaxID=97972 RepID=A0A2V1DTT9_9PLEO|nr:aldehyde dehydrogenase family protein [Periconia macrospinosa]
MTSSVASPHNEETSITVPLWIDGDEVFGQSTFDVVSSSSNSVCWKATSASIADATKAVETAQTAFKSWSLTKPAYRTHLLLKVAAILESNAPEYAQYMSTEMGADISVSQFFVMPLAIQMLKDIAGRASTICGSVPTCQQDGQSCIVFKEPYGVTFGIVPWNAPFVFGIRSAATALATGNTTILKASELTPRSYWAIGKAFHEAGLPKGVLNIISCPPSQAAEITDFIIEHPLVKKINFTGSTAIGRKIARSCGQHLKPCLMELGGKNSAIVLEDANLQLAAQACLAGSFINAGQICMATDRLIVQNSVAKEFLQILKDSLIAGSSDSPLPRVVSTGSKARLNKLLLQAVSQGATVAFGSNGEESSLETTTFVPTIMQGVDSSMTLWDEESFGPVVTISEVEGEEDAVALANSTGYGLSASIFTRDLRKGLAIAKKIESGAVHINSMTIHDEPALPFGGVKNSGWGRFNSEQGMEEFLVTKSVTWDD